MLLKVFDLKSCALPDFSTCVFTTTDVQPLFTLEDRPLTAKEGSCIEIKCTVAKAVDDANAYWFWIKGAIWVNKTELTGTVIYSTNSAVRPVSRDFADRVNYTGSPSSSWSSYDSRSPKLCSILICNLNKTDSGNYSFRFVGKPETYKWITEPAVILTVSGEYKNLNTERYFQKIQNESKRAIIEMSWSRGRNDRIG